MKIKSGCYAKFDAVLLVGSNAVKLNDTYEILKIAHNIQSINFTYLNEKKFNRINFSNLNDISLLDPNIEFSHKLKNHSFDNCFLLICIVSTAIIVYLMISCIKCINFKAKCNIQSKNKGIKNSNKNTELNKNNEQNGNSNTSSIKVDQTSSLP